MPSRAKITCHRTTTATVPVHARSAHCQRLEFRLAINGEARGHVAYHVTGGVASLHEHKVTPRAVDEAAALGVVLDGVVQKMLAGRPGAMAGVRGARRGDGCGSLPVARRMGPELGHDRDWMAE